MNTLIANPTVPQVGEPEVQRMTDIRNAALENLKITAITAFDLLWDDPETRAAKLAVMGTNAVAAFEQHARTVQYLLESGVALDPADYTPPVTVGDNLGYTKHDDGTITLD